MLVACCSGGEGAAGAAGPDLGRGVAGERELGGGGWRERPRLGACGGLLAVCLLAQGGAWLVQGQRHGEPVLVGDLELADADDVRFAQEDEAGFEGEGAGVVVFGAGEGGVGEVLVEEFGGEVRSWEEGEAEVVSVEGGAGGGIFL